VERICDAAFRLGKKLHRTDDWLDGWKAAPPFPQLPCRRTWAAKGRIHKEQSETSNSRPSCTTKRSPLSSNSTALRLNSSSYRGLPAPSFTSLLILIHVRFPAQQLIHDTISFDDYQDEVPTSKSVVGCHLLMFAVLLSPRKSRVKKLRKCYSFGVAEKTLRFKVVIPKVKSFASSKKIKAAVKSVRDGKK
jgi:hypothetical protein